MRGYAHCYGHRSDLADQRRRNASRGGRTGGRGRAAGGELADLKRDIRGVIDSVLSGELKTGAAAVSLQGYNSLLRACEIQRRTADLGDLMTRLEELERRAERLRGA
ncbi:MAG: hypothetical protein M3Q49_03945 [Actinomycetota bacterium]|nr:hypothetical protein [Actinomycetota bacterium]